MYRTVQHFKSDMHVRKQADIRKWHGYNQAWDNFYLFQVNKLDIAIKW